MKALRKKLTAGTETEFEFDAYEGNSVIVKNETPSGILFCDQVFNATKAVHIPAFSWQSLKVDVVYGNKPKFYVKSVAGGDVEINLGSDGMGQLGNVLDVAGLVPHTLTMTAAEGTAITASLTRLHGQTLDLDAPVALTSGATVFYGDVVAFSATVGAGFSPVLTINGAEVALDEGAAIYVIVGETLAAVAAVEEG